MRQFHRQPPKAKNHCPEVTRSFVVSLNERKPSTNIQIIYDHNSYPFSGGCACGAIRYESTAEPVMMLHCHCRDCQRSSGGPFSSFVIVPTEAFKLLQGSL